MRYTTILRCLLLGVVLALTSSVATAAAFEGTETITFEGREEGEPITTQYEAKGIIFSGATPEEPPFIAWDESSLTNPVLSGFPRFHGPIHGKFVLPGTSTAASVNGLAMDVGFIDDPGSVTLTIETTSGNETLTAEEWGFNHLETEAANITGFTVEEASYDEYGFEIDNVSFDPASPPPPPPPAPAPAPAPPPPPPPTPVANNCPVYMVIDSRGSGENLVVHGHTTPEISPPAAYFASGLRHRHPSASLSFVSNPYPAVGFGLDWRKLLNLVGAKLKIAPVGAHYGSVVDGTKWLDSEVASEVAACPSTQLLLVGYSQGAQVTADAYQRDISSAESDHILGVVLFGDPYFNPADPQVDRGTFQHSKAGVLGTRPIFKTTHTVLSYCHLHDPICQGLKEYLGYHLTRAWRTTKMMLSSAA